MATWTDNELTKIGKAEELHLASRRPDGKLGGAVTIWVVREGDSLYVRSYRGSNGSWYRNASRRREGHIRAGGVDKDVTFSDADPAVNDRIDAAYRSKYRRYGASIVDPMVSPQARATTIQLTPR